MPKGASFRELDMTNQVLLWDDAAKTVGFKGMLGCPNVSFVFVLGFLVAVSVGEERIRGQVSYHPALLV